jgi:hypothetical protein
LDKNAKMHRIQALSAIRKIEMENRYRNRKFKRFKRSTLTSEDRVKLEKADKNSKLNINNNNNNVNNNKEDLDLDVRVPGIINPNYTSKNSNTNNNNKLFFSFYDLFCSCFMTCINKRRAIINSRIQQYFKSVNNYEQILSKNLFNNVYFKILLTKQNKDDLEKIKFFNINSVLEYEYN